MPSRRVSCGQNVLTLDPCPPPTAGTPTAPGLPLPVSSQLQPSPHPFPTHQQNLHHSTNLLHVYFSIFTPSSPFPSPLARSVLVGLYEEPERPPNAVEYVKKVMGAPVGVDVDALRAENEQLRQMVERLTKE